MFKQWLSRRPLFAFGFASILAMALYSVIYIGYPFSPLANDLWLNAIYLFSVISPAWIASAVRSNYDANDSPGKIWVYFLIGFWSWAVAEIIWIGYNMAVGEVPHVNLSDPFYLAGYILMTFAIASQYRQTRQQGVMSERALVLLLWLTMLLVSVLIFFVTELAYTPSSSAAEQVGAFLNIIYGVGDMTLALTALILVTRFQGGALGRPWWGFIILALADIFYGWLAQTGAYDYQTLTGNLLRLSSDLIYMLSFLVIAYSFLRQYVLLKFGPVESSPTVPRR